MSGREFGRFLCECILHPVQIGAMAPSSRGLSWRMARWIDWQAVDTVVEYGPGTGVLTELILECKRPDAKFFAVEVNRRFAEILETRFPDVPIFRDSVANIEAICRQQGIDQVDAVMCGLPWAAFPDRDQTMYLDTMMKVLKPGGYFASFAYVQGLALPAARRFRKKLRHYFSEVRVSRTVWLNVPPAFAYQCRR